MRKTCIITFSLLIILFIVNANASLSKGAIVEFGHYEQDGNLDNGTEPIQWYIIDTDESTYTLLSCYIIDFHQFHSKANDTTWAKSDLRKWLNDSFYHSAFSKADQECILKKNNTTLNYYTTLPEDSTKDYVYLLSQEEAYDIYGHYWTVKLPSHFVAKATLYAKQNGDDAFRQMGVANSKIDSTYERWLLRSTVDDYVWIGGSAVYSSFKTSKVFKDYAIGGIRPVVTVSIKKSQESVSHITAIKDYTSAPLKKVSPPTNPTYDLAFCHLWKSNTEFLLIDTSKKIVVRFYKKHNSSHNTPDYGTYSGDLYSGATVNFTYYQSPVTLMYSVNDGSLNWLGSDGSISTSYSGTDLASAINYLNNSK